MKPRFLLVASEALSPGETYLVTFFSHRDLLSTLFCIQPSLPILILPFHLLALSVTLPEPLLKVEVLACPRMRALLFVPDSFLPSSLSLKITSSDTPPLSK